MEDGYGHVPEKVRSRLDNYLDDVEAALVRAGKGREARRAIADDLEAQLLEMLAERTRGRTPTLDDVESLLAQMDSPQAYADTSFVEAQKRDGSDGAGRASMNRKGKHVMKILFLVTLIVCGTLLVATPAASDYLLQRRVWAVIASQPDLTQFSVSAHRMDDWSRFGFWFTGTGMIVAAIWLGVRRRTASGGV